MNRKLVYTRKRKSWKSETALIIFNCTGGEVGLGMELFCLEPVVAGRGLGAEYNFLVD
jgi:hypothetical protein